MTVRRGTPVARAAAESLRPLRSRRTNLLDLLSGPSHGHLESNIRSLMKIGSDSHKVGTRGRDETVNMPALGAGGESLGGSTPPARNPRSRSPMTRKTWVSPDVRQ